MAHGRCLSCGGGIAQHQGDQGCWCPVCLEKPRQERCAGFVQAPAAPAKKEPPPVDRDVVRVGRDHPETAHKAADKALPRSGTLRRQVYDAIAAAGPRGATDDEIEQTLNRSHQSVSGARNTLSGDDLIRDSGLRRKTRYRNDAIAWVVTDAEAMATMGATSATPLLRDDIFAEVSNEGVASIRFGLLAVSVASGQQEVRVTLDGETVRLLADAEVVAEAVEVASSPFSEEDEIREVTKALLHPVSKLLRAGLKELA